MRKRRIVTVSPAKLEAFLQHNFETQADFLEKAVISRSTLNRMLTQVPVNRKTLVDMVANLNQARIEITSDDLLLESERHASAEELASAWQQDEWEVIPGTLNPPTPMSNGLVMQSAKVRHRLIENEFGRAKVYDIRGLGRELRLLYRDTLTRHAAVCRKLFDCPQISTNITMVAQNDYQIWTIVDRWVDGRSLNELVRQSPLDVARALPILTEVAVGMNCLHRLGIVGREIRPETVIVSSDLGHCTLTDLELAKLLDTDVTVSAYWLPNAFRAPEIQGRTCKPQADIFTLAKVAVFILTGQTLKDSQDCQTLLASELPSKVATFLASSLEPSWKNRPESLDELLLQLRGNQ